MYQLVDLQVKSSMKLQNVFRRVSQVSRGASDTVDGDEKEKKVETLFCKTLVNDGYLIFTLFGKKKL